MVVEECFVGSIIISDRDSRKGIGEVEGREVRICRSLVVGGSCGVRGLQLFFYAEVSVPPRQNDSEIHHSWK